jgi:hypothetical protein
MSTDWLYAVLFLSWAILGFLYVTKVR